MRIITREYKPLTRHQEIKQLIRFAAKTAVGLDHTGIEVHVKNTYNHGCSGFCYNSPLKFGSPDWIKQSIVIKIGPDHFFPEKFYLKYKKVPDYEVANWQEAVILVVAHELRHLWQFRNKKPMSEVDAEKISLRAIEKWRKHQKSS